MSRLPLLLIAPLLALAACGGSGPADADATTHSSLTEKVVREVREEMAAENLDVGRDKEGLSRAEITPEGQLLIAGEAVPMNAEQRALAIAYRQDVAAIAVAGAAIGMEAAGLAKDSVVAALEGVFSGEGSAGVEAKVKAQTKRIESSALQLCDQLPKLLASQNALAAALPEFAPYADMDESDIDDCHVNVNENGESE